MHGQIVSVKLMLRWEGVSESAQLVFNPPPVRKLVGNTSTYRDEQSQILLL